MLDLGIGGGELLVIAAIALIVVGPKDLPLLMRRVGQFMAKLRGMASEFRASFDEMARQSELDELRKEVEALRRGDPLQPVRDEIEPHMRAIDSEVRGYSVGGYPDPSAELQEWAPSTSEFADAASDPAKDEAPHDPAADAPPAELVASPVPIAPTNEVSPEPTEIAGEPEPAPKKRRTRARKSDDGEAVT